MIIRKTTLYFIGIIIIIGIVGFFMISNEKPITNEIKETDNSEIQEVVIGMKNYNYYPNTIEVLEDKPVRIYLDKSVVGCFRSFTIRSLGISKNLRTPNDYIEFTPTEKGEFTFACSMGMGQGKLIVK